jgi:hypothetical protein
VPLEIFAASVASVVADAASPEISLCVKPLGELMVGEVSVLLVSVCIAVRPTSCSSMPAGS